MQVRIVLGLKNGNILCGDWCAGERAKIEKEVNDNILANFSKISYLTIIVHGIRYIVFASAVAYMYIDEIDENDVPF